MARVERRWELSGRTLRMALLAQVLVLPALVNAQQKPADARVFEAIDEENMEGLQAALAAGASLHARNRYGATPLVAAAAQGNARMFKALIEAGADVNEPDGNKSSATTQAAFDNQIDVLRVLLPHHPDVDWQDGRGDSAVSYAINRRNMEVLGLLIDAGASLNLVNPNTRHSVLTQAYVDNDDFELIAVLQRSGAHFADATDELFAAAARNDVEEMHAAITANAEVNFANRYGETPLCVAARKGNTQAVRLLLSAGASAETTGSDRHTALEWAFVSQHLSTVEALLDAGADALAPVSGQRTMLFSAAWGFDDRGLIERLMAAGVAINKTDITGQTALFAAAQAGHGSVVELLLKDGADPTIRDRHGKAAADYAHERHDDALAAMLLEAAQNWAAGKH